MKVYAIPRSDGGVSIMRMVDGADLAREIDNYKARNPALVLGEPVEIAAADIPQDRTFRGAWKVVAGRVNESLPEAKAIAEERVPEKATEIRAAADVPTLRAIVGTVAK